MFCTQCGASSDDGARFCRTCGATLPTSSSTATPGTAEGGSTSASTYGGASPMAGAGSAATSVYTPSGVLPSNLGTGPTTYAARRVEYAGFWRRFAALIIDSILVWVITFVIGFVIGFVMTLASPRSSDVAAGIAGLVGLVIGILYFPFMESSAGQATLGKKALGIIVTDLDGNRIGFGRALGRYFAKILSSLILCIGYLMAAFTQRKQALHDFIVGTLVVKGPPSAS